MDVNIRRNTHGEMQYIKHQYVKQGILKPDGHKDKMGAVDYNLYPWEGSVYIPKCQICEETYTNFVKTALTEHDDEFYSPHYRCGCLWWNWFEEKIVNLHKKVIFTSHKKNRIQKKTVEQKKTVS